MPDVKLHCALTGVLLAGLAFGAQAAPTAAVTGPALPPPVAIPVPADLPADTLNLARLERIQSDTLLYEAQGARAKALLSLQQNNGYDASVPSALTQTLLAPAPGQNARPGHHGARQPAAHCRNCRQREAAAGPSGACRRRGRRGGRRPARAGLGPYREAHHRAGGAGHHRRRGNPHPGVH